MPIILLLLGAGAYLFYNQAKQFQSSYRILFKDASFDFDKTKNAGFTSLYFKIRIEVENPTDFAGTLQSAKFNLSYNGKEIGYIPISNPVTITSKAITKIELPVSVPTVAIISSITQIIQAITEKKSILFKLSGQLNFAIGTLTINQDYKVPLLY